MTRNPHPRCKLCRQNHPLGQCPKAPRREEGMQRRLDQTVGDYVRAIASRGGRASAARLTPEERSERARKAALKRWHNVLKSERGS